MKHADKMVLGDRASHLTFRPVHFFTCKWQGIVWIIPSVRKDTEELELSYTAGRNVKCCHHFGKHFLENVKLSILSIHR